MAIDPNLTSLLKGFSCIVIALHHYSQVVLSHGISTNPIYFIFSSQGGYSGVAMFFFLSGYGIMESESRKHLNILQFIKKRFWKVYKAVLIINTIEYLSILIYNYCTTGMWDDFHIIKIIGITSQDSVLWFIDYLFVCYLAFMICTKFTNQKEWILGAFTIAIPAILWALGGSFTYLQSVPLFFIGTLVSCKKVETAKLVKKWLTWVLLIIVTVVSVFLAKRNGNMMPIHFTFDYVMIMGMIYVCSIFVVSLKYKSLLGAMSFPVYLVHHKLIQCSMFLGHLLPVWLFLVLTLYFAWLLKKHLESCVSGKSSRRFI